MIILKRVHQRHKRRIKDQIQEQVFYHFRKPDIKFVFTGKPTHDVAHEIHIRLENSLPILMTKGVFQIEGSGIESPILLKVN